MDKKQITSSVLKVTRSVERVDKIKNSGDEPRYARHRSAADERILLIDAMADVPLRKKPSADEQRHSSSDSDQHRRDSLSSIDDVDIPAEDKAVIDAQAAKHAAAVAADAMDKKRKELTKNFKQKSQGVAIQPRP
jgi:hypothetical protein